MSAQPFLVVALEVSARTWTQLGVRGTSPALGFCLLADFHPGATFDRICIECHLTWNINTLCKSYHMQVPVLFLALSSSKISISSTVHRNLFFSVPFLFSLPHHLHWTPQGSLCFCCAVTLLVARLANIFMSRSPLCAVWIENSSVLVVV